MKKEVLIAILIGIGVGLIATVGLFIWQNQSPTQQIILNPLVEKPGIPSSPSFPSSTITITSPLDESISQEPKTKIIGVAPPSTWILILTEKGEKIVQTDDRGNFETEINLISGENQIELKCFDQNQEIAQKIITIVHTTAEI